MAMCDRCHGKGYYFQVPKGFNPFEAGGWQTARVSQRISCDCESQATCRAETHAIGGQGECLLCDADQGQACLRSNLETES